jgi:hypothetical protein
MAQVSMASVFYLGGVAALSGVVVFLGVLSYDHGRAALTAW